MPVPLWEGRIRAARARVRLCHALNILFAVLLLAGCAAQPDMQGTPAVSLRPVDAGAIRGWNADRVSTMLPALLRQCRRLALLPADADLGGSGGAAAAGGKAG